MAPANRADTEHADPATANSASAKSRPTQPVPSSERMEVSIRPTAVRSSQPSFKLKSKTRDGARVHKVYFTPATPCDRLLVHSSVEPVIKEQLKAQFEGLDPVQLLQEIRHAQQVLSDIAALDVGADVMTARPSELSDFVSSLATAWKDGEARPTHRKRPTAKRWWRTRVDPFADAWPVIEGWPIAEPSVTANVLMNRLATMIPDAYATKAKLRTLQRRVKAWRAARAKGMVLGAVRKLAITPAEV